MRSMLMIAAIDVGQERSLANVCYRNTVRCSNTDFKSPSMRTT